MKNILKIKKHNVEKKKSIVGNGIDYCNYEMKLKDYFIGYAAGFIISFIGIQIFFERVIFSIFFGFGIGFVAINIYKKYIIN